MLSGSMVLLTGGSGFIGRHFHRFMPENSLINLDLNVPGFHHGAEFIQGDIRIEEDVRKAMKGRNVQTVICLAAKHHDFGIDQSEYFQTNEEGTRVICRLASEHQVKQIIYYSTVAVYGQTEAIASETTEARPDTAYGASKLAGETVLHEWASGDGERKVLIMRPTIVFGPNHLANMKNLVRQIDSGFYFHLGNARVVKSIAYVDNLVRATLFLVERMSPGVQIYNYADEPQLSMREIADHIAHFLNQKIRFSVPMPLGVLLGKPFDVAISLTGRNLPISSARIRKLGTQTHYSARKVFDAGFVPELSTIEGLQRMVEWYKHEKQSSGRNFMRSEM